MSPLDQFKIVSYFSIGPIDFTNSTLAMLISCVCVLYFLWILPQVSRFFRTLADLYYGFIDNLARTTIGHGYEFLLPFISSIFLFILFGNLIGLIPGFFTFTSQPVTNAVLSGSVIFGTLTITIARHGLRFVRLFCPSGIPLWLMPLMCPIEIFTFFMKIFSLALRLCINMCVGHLMLEVFLTLASQFGPLGPAIGLIYLPFYGVEIGLSILQAYIFTIISCISLKDSIELGH